METTGLGALNWAVIVIYLLAMLGVGVYFTRRASKSTDSYFRAQGRIPAWAAGFSIYATTLSAITYMSTPEQAYLSDWSYAAGSLAIFAIVPVLIAFYVPFFRKLNVVTAYDYLEERFSPAMRLIGSLMFVLFHIGRIAVVIYLPTLAISSVTEINPVLVAAIVGMLSIIYTFLGGIEGVIWADVLQGIILLLGAVVIIGFGLFTIDGGLGTVASDAIADDKLISGKDWDLGEMLGASIPIIFIGSVFTNLYQYTGSQDVVQRYQTTASSRETARSLLTNGVLSLITIPLFYGMGTLLYSYFKHTSPLPDSVNTSAIVPYFVVHVLPAGVSGVVLAAIFAAAQSTLSSSLNSISACLTVDVWDRFLVRRGARRSSVGLARAIIIVAGIIGTGAALYLASTDQAETWNLFLSILGLFGTPIAAVFALGIFTRHANAVGVIAGLVVGSIAAWIVQDSGSTPFMVACFAFVGTVIVGYLVSLVRNAIRPGGGDGHDIRPLTIFGTRSTYVRRTQDARG
ncbi:sodium:solute symporter [Brachybacterium halotolerans subsp. kimchii]|uniref:sodium:solute symporter n=1 Tax=Brachybacterium halotolerans TaxID=2795215 RepID=UPI001E458E4A|nr:sodium:solute symporter [Brachybacterium halotolerans]UEJ82054.1 sodium:solute symporter [Brachybacterium halotolerans subsp. kimchii]